MEKTELVCKDLSKSYSGKTIFKNLNLSLQSGQSVAITGRNGSGKSTLVKVMANLIQANCGTVNITYGGNIVERDNLYKITSLLSPYLSLYDELTGGENLEFFYKLKSGISTGVKDKIEYFLKRVNLFEKRNELLKNYSSGMKQRLKLAFAVMNEPEILFLDEPRSNLDKSGIDIVNEIASEQRQDKILIIATNDEDDKLLCNNSINIEDFK